MVIHGRKMLPVELLQRPLGGLLYLFCMAREAPTNAGTDFVREEQCMSIL